MKKVIYRQFGNPDVLELVDAPSPEVKNNEVLVKIKAVSINPLDWKIFEGQMAMMTGKKFPKNIGIDFSGTVENSTSKFKKGDEVFGMLDSFKGGALAEYIVVPENTITLKPQNITFEQASTLPVVGLSALDILNKLGNVKKGDEILINGATGGIGIFLTQFAKKKGAIITTVTGTSGLNLVRQWNVDFSLDYTQQNVLNINKQFDVIVDLSGKMKLAEAKNIMKDKAIFISTLPEPVSIIRSFFNNLFSSKKHKLLMLNPSEEKLKSLSQLAQEGLDFVIDKTYPIEAVVQAYQYAKKGITGKVVITL
jgi:NADPH:quinone reductase-like Zn-dependent oxidoreductase